MGAIVGVVHGDRVVGPHGLGEVHVGRAFVDEALAVTVHDDGASHASGGAHLGNLTTVLLEPGLDDGRHTAERRHVGQLGAGAHRHPQTVTFVERWADG